MATTTSEPSTTKTRTARRRPQAASSSSAKGASTAARSKQAGYSQGTVIGIAAAGMLAGLVAAVGRKAVVQAASALSGDWFEALKTEHKLAFKLFDKIEATRDSQTTKRTILLMQLKHALAKHAFEEENVIYPALRDHDEREEADHLNHDHGYVKQFLYDLEQLPKSSSAWLAKVREFRAALEKHVREEEDTIFPELHARLDKEENGHLTTAMNREGFKLA